MSMPSSSEDVATSAAQRAGLQQVLDLDALRARERAVVRAHERLAGELVERAGQPLGEPAAVDEDQRRAMRLNQLEQPRMDGRSRSTVARSPATPVRSGSPRPRRACAMSSTGTSIVSSSAFFCAGIDDRDGPVGGTRAIGRRTRRGSRPRDRRSAAAPSCVPVVERRRACCAPPRNRATSSSGRCVADSPMRCSGRRGERLEPLERQREVRAALGRDERVDLVDDHGVDRAQRLARVRGEQQVERLGRRDQDVGRLALEPRALGGRRVAGADGDRGHVKRRRRGARPVGDAGERRAQVALDVDRQRLERRDVEDAASPRRFGGAGANISRSMAQRNAASVLPLPVGARISVDSPRAMAGQPSACGGVGASNDAWNQSATAP